MNLQQIKDLIEKNITGVIVIGICLLGTLCFLMVNQSGKKSIVTMPIKDAASKDIGISIGGVDQQAYMARLEKNYYDFEDRVKQMESSIKSVAEELKNSQQEATRKLNKNLAHKIDKKLDEFRNDFSLENNKNEGSSLLKELELSIADVASLDNQDWVYLPIGSFCQGTLLTGVYAAADLNNPLPVLISLDEAFYGPNKTRVPLKGAFVLGKAFGDLTSERALIQIVAISTVLPNGHTFEQEQDLGYVADEAGELGVKGQVVYNTGRQLALSFMGGFVSGGSQAMADSQVTTHKTMQGDTSRDVTGSPSKNMLFSGLAQSAGRLAEFYQKQAEDLVPAVHIKNGAKVFFIVQKGVTINGLAKSDFNHKRFMD